MIRKTLYTLLLTALIIPLVGIFSHVDVFAEGAYKVCNVDDNGNLVEVNSFGSYEEAYNLMVSEKDYVITHEDSMSPTKIIAMNRGLVLSFPYRKATNTMSIYEGLDSKYNGDSNLASTYVQAYVEMNYHSTVHYFEAGQHNMNYGHGYVYVTVNGFDGYCDLEAVDLIPMKIVELEKTIVIGGNSKGNYSSIGTLTITPRQHYYYIKADGEYLDLCLREYDHQELNGTEPATYGIRYGVAPSFMEANVNYYSEDGINFYTSRDLDEETYVGTYYNYYQFLPLRTYSNIKASTINAYISAKGGNKSVMLNTGDDFINNQNIYGMNGAAIAAMGIHESGFGTSNIAGDKFNIFGWGAYDANTKMATTYDSVSECIASQMGDNLSNYLDVNCDTYYTMSLGNKGGGFITRYASDPYWAEEIAQYYYELDKRDNDRNGNLTDYNTYNLALVNVVSEVKAEANSSSTTLFRTCHKTGYQENMIVTVLDTNNGFAKIQTSNPIKDGEVIYPYSLPKGTKVEYNKDTSVGYISLNNITYLNGNNNDVNLNVDELVGIAVVYNFKLNENTITTNGVAAIRNLNFTSNVGVSHKLVLTDIKDNNNAYVLDLNTEDTNGFTLNDGYDYRYAGFRGDLSLDEIPNGNYVVSLRITNGQYTKDVILNSTAEKFSNVTCKYLNVTNRLTTNERYNYRFELEISNTAIDYSLINKPTIRQSLFTFDKIDITEDGYLQINAVTMIYYLNYDDPEKVNYNVYLVKDADNTVVVPSTLSACPINYNAIIEDYDATNICYSTSKDIKDLSGSYRLLVEVTNTNNDILYRDYVEMTNMSNRKMPEVIIDGVTYKIVKDDVRDRMILKVGE